MKNSQSLMITARHLSNMAPVVTALVLGVLLASGCSTSLNLKDRPQDPKFSARLSQMTVTEAQATIRRVLEESFDDDRIFYPMLGGNQLLQARSNAATLYQMALHDTNSTSTYQVYPETGSHFITDWIVPGRGGNVSLTDTSHIWVARYFFADKFVVYKSWNLVLNDQGQYVRNDTVVNPKAPGEALSVIKSKDDMPKNKMDSPFVLTLFDKGQSLRFMSIDLADLADVNRIARFGSQLSLFNKKHSFIPFITLHPSHNEKEDFLNALYVLCPKLRFFREV